MAKGLDLIPGWATKIPQATWPKQQQQKKRGEKNQPQLIFRTSLVVQWLRIRLAMQGTWVQSLVGELRSHKPWGN